jgi:hypothetical protein
MIPNSIYMKKASFTSSRIGREKIVAGRVIASQIYLHVAIDFGCAGMIVMRQNGVESSGSLDCYD